jgi:hypothetical protein
VKYCFYPLLLAGLALGQSGTGQSNTTQSDTTQYTTDINGHRVIQAQAVTRDGERTELTQSINGRVVPLARSETRVLSEEPNRRVTETVVRHYDTTGQLASTERTVSEDQKRANGSLLHATVYRSDANGRLAEAERRTIETQNQGTSTTTAVTIARAGLSGSFETTEKRQVVTTIEGNTTRESEVIERPSQSSGQFYEAARQVREETKAGNKTTSSTVMYGLDYAGKMSLIHQEAASTVKNSDGTLVTERNLYAPSTDGVARDQQGRLKLLEQQTIVRKESGATVTETAVVRRATLADSNRLGEASVVSDLVCSGKCEGPLQAQRP